MILLFRFPILKNFPTLITNHRTYVISSLKKSLRRVGTPKPKVTVSKFQKLGILSGVIFQGIVVAKCSSGTQAAIKIKTELYSKPPESFDWRLLCHLLRSEIWRILLAVAAAIAVAIINVQLPIHLGRVIDVLSNINLQNVDSSFLQQLKEPAVRLLSIYVLQAFFTFVYVDLLSTVGENLASNLKNKLFTSVMQQDLAFFDRNRTGEIIDRLTTDVQEFKSAFKLCVSQGIRSGTQILGCVISLISISPEMTGVMLLILPTCILIGTFIGSKLRAMSRVAQDQAAWSTIQAEEVIANIRTVRAFAMEHHECEKFKEEVDKTGHLLKKLGFGIALFQAGTNIFLNGIVLLTLGMGGYMLSLKKLSTGNIMSFLVAMQTIQKSLTQISLLFGYFVKGVASGTRVFQYIELTPKVPLLMNAENIISIDSFQTDIKFEGVSFSYPTRPEQMVLKNFTLSIPAGKVVAIVGSSGNGKSTVAALLLKFYNANKGRIEIGGVNINDLDENWLRGKIIGFINQEPVLFATSIKENIRYGNPLATDEEVYEAAKLANADNFITGFPKGYETVVGEKGIAISGGQKQRIAIARAFLKKPKILVLDEATSALDTISEQQVQKTLESVMQGKTVVVIAHRLTTIKNADIIVVLDNGVVVEVGQHDELLQKKGFYWNLMNKQEKQKHTIEGSVQ